jgi:NAD(P)-dependent dehydrogenase (short-subunit alcohol dehydrogenase family)
MSQTIVITGSTRGIGFGLAESFLKLGCSVVISGRGQAGVDKAVAELGERHAREKILGQPCDVANYVQVQALWDAAKARFGRVDIWVNNAGMGNVMMPFWQQPPERLRDVVNINIIGTMYGCKVAIQGMIEQGGGHVYLMEGSGSNGRIQPGLTPYNTSKRAIRYLTDSLVKETTNTPVKVSAISPGIVITEMLMSGLGEMDVEQGRRIFNILGDRVETVTPWLAQKMLENERSGARIDWLTTPKILWRFLSASFRKRDIIGEA